MLRDRGSISDIVQLRRCRAVRDFAARGSDQSLKSSFHRGAFAGLQTKRPEFINLREASMPRSSGLPSVRLRCSRVSKDLETLDTEAFHRAKYIFAVIV